jgi:diguanylate cyclase (GGDEF)-like protein
LANRRHFDNVLETEIRRSARAGTPISLVAIDLDNFKAYNDEHGHPRGDQCLVMVAAILRSAGRRPTDLPARLGGDEFALLLVDSDETGSQRVAQKIIKAIRSLGMTASKTRQVTASIGVVTVVPDATLEGASLIQDADNALYIAKNAGRDRVERTTPSNLMPVVQVG